MVASDPELDRKRVVVVRLSTKPGPDVPACFVDEGEHPSISKKSYVRCERAGFGPLEALEAALRMNFVTLSQPLSGNVLARIQRALFESDHTTLELKAVLEEQFFGN